MTSIAPPEPLSLPLLRTTTTATVSAAFHLQLPCLLCSHPSHRLLASSRTVVHSSDRNLGPRKSFAVSAGSSTLMTNSVPPRNGVYTVGDFVTRKEALHVVKPTTTVDEALETLVENRITGFLSLMMTGNWLALFPTMIYWHWTPYQVLDELIQTCFLKLTVLGKYTFNDLQKLLSKTNGQAVSDLMTPAPVVVRENTNLEDAARLLLETKYRQLPVVDSDGKLVGALQIKRASEMKA